MTVSRGCFQIKVSQSELRGMNIFPKQNKTNKKRWLTVKGANLWEQFQKGNEHCVQMYFQCVTLKGSV